MFARSTDASKIALAALVAFCRRTGIDWIDWALLLDLPAVAIPACMTAIKKRREFRQNLLEAGEEA